MQLLLFIALLIIIGSAVLSCAEAALFTISLSKTRIFIADKRRGAQALSYLKDNIQEPIVVLVVLTNVFNIVGSIVVGALAAKIFSNALIGVISAALTFLIIVFGEIIPKTIGENYAETISLSIAPPLLVLTKLFSPFIWLLEEITKPFIKKSKIVSEEEIKMMSQLGHLEGVIEKDEKEMIRNVFLLNDIRVKDIMTPRIVVEALKAEKTIGEIEETIYRLSHSRLPVYRNNLDDITGIVHQKDLLIALGKDKKNRKIKSFQRKTISVSEKMRVDILLQFLLKKRCHLAVVKDEFGGTSGIVTLEDALEQLVGEIVDEKDKQIDMREEAKIKRKLQSMHQLT
jgi:CBS domain containing-hemolysin-like protein